MMRAGSGRTQERAATWIAVGLVLAGVGIAARSVMLVPRFVAPPRTPLDPGSPVDPKPAEKLQLAALRERNLRQTLADLPPPAAVRQAEPTLPIQLVGTAIESQRRFGVFAVSNRSLIREVGSEIEGYRVVSIERGLARLQRDERSIELRVPWYEKLQRSLIPAEGQP